MVGGHGVDPVLQLGAEADHAGPVPQQRPELTDRRRGDSRLGQQVGAQPAPKAGIRVMQPVVEAAPHVVAARRPVPHPLPVAARDRALSGCPADR